MAHITCPIWGTPASVTKERDGYSVHSLRTGGDFLLRDRQRRF